MLRSLFLSLICLLTTLAAAQPTRPAEAQMLRAEVITTRPHDPRSYTQGFELHNGLLLESAGMYGPSNLRETDPYTGEVLRSVPLPRNQFAEGLTRVGDRLIQLTWREQIAHVYNRDTFERIGEFRYKGEGWGLCYDGNRLIMSNGSEHLAFRDPQTFDELTSVTVTLNGQPMQRLNELEYAEGFVYANVYLTNQIVKIDPKTGEVAAVIVVDGLLTKEEAAKAEVLNGIAYDATTRTFLITGKYWPKTFEVIFVPR